jgi:hypothetical protein
VPLLDRHLQHRPSAAVGDLELQAAEAGGLHRQLAIRPERLLKDRPKVRQVDALGVLDPCHSDYDSLAGGSGGAGLG